VIENVGVKFRTGAVFDKAEYYNIGVERPCRLEKRVLFRAFFVVSFPFGNLTDTKCRVAVCFKNLLFKKVDVVLLGSGCRHSTFQIPAYGRVNAVKRDRIADEHHAYAVALKVVKAYKAIFLELIF
jgi:hypothetical protein